MLNVATYETIGAVRRVESGRGGRKWLRLTLPVDRSYMDGDTKVERTSWFEAVCFKPKLIEIIERLNVKDRRVRIKGAIVVGTRELAGQRIRATTFQIDQLDLLDPKPRD